MLLKFLYRASHILPHFSLFLLDEYLFLTLLVCYYQLWRYNIFLAIILGCQLLGVVHFEKKDVLLRALIEILMRLLPLHLNLLTAELDELFEKFDLE